MRCEVVGSREKEVVWNNMDEGSAKSFVGCIELFIDNSWTILESNALVA